MVNHLGVSLRRSLVTPIVLLLASTLAIATTRTAERLGLSTLGRLGGPIAMAFLPSGNLPSIGGSLIVPLGTIGGNMSQLIAIETATVVVATGVNLQVVRRRSTGRIFPVVARSPQASCFDVLIVSYCIITQRFHITALLPDLPLTLCLGKELDLGDQLLHLQQLINHLRLVDLLFDTTRLS